MPYPKRKTRFIDLPRHRRATVVRKLRERIRRLAPIYGGLYSSPHLPGDVNAFGQPRAWVDVSFLGRDKFTCWGAELILPPVALADLRGGVFQAGLARFIAANGFQADPPVLREYCYVDLNFRQRKVVFMVVDAECLTRPVIEAAIRRFLDLGERNWVSSEPLRYLTAALPGADARDEGNDPGGVS